MQTARRHCRFACVALVLIAGAVACSQPDDVVVSVAPQTDGTDGGGLPMNTGGSGGVAVGSGGAGVQQPAAPCALPDWYYSASRIDMMNCRIPKDDPAVQFTEKYLTPMQPSPAGGEGILPDACDFVTTWFFQDPAFPDEFTLCPMACTGLRAAAAMELDRYRKCLDASMSTPQPQP